LKELEDDGGLKWIACTFEQQFNKITSYHYFCCGFIEGDEMSNNKVQ